MQSTNPTDHENDASSRPKSASRSNARMLALIGAIGTLAAIGTNRALQDWTVSVIVGGIAMLVIVALFEIGGTSRR